MSSPSSYLRSTSWFAYLELVRLPAVFTAMADVVMGFLFTHPRLPSRDRWELALILAASSALYLAGMVLNDVFDLRTDARERPRRPLPSRRISVSAAQRLGWGLLAVGLALAWGAVAWGDGGLRPGWIGTLLAGCIVLYDGYLKRTALGPVGMGACRALNVLLGMSLAATGWRPEHWLVAGALGVYIAGVTWFARNEATRSHRWHLLAAMGVMLAGISLLLEVPHLTDETVVLLQQQPIRWTLLIGALGLLISYRCLGAVIDPTARRVQLAVRHCLTSLVMLDAAISFVVWDIPGAIAVMLLLIPTIFLGQWIYST